MKEFIPDEEITSPGGGFIRKGGCTAGCGACCEFVILPLDPRILRAGREKIIDFITWAELHGLSIYQSGDWVSCRIPLSCKHLVEDSDGDKHCGIMGQPERPKLCSRFPRFPVDLEGIQDVCAYTFEPKGGENG